jgi:hypothetical protein
MGSEEGLRDTAFIGGRGVPGWAGDLPVIFRANFRKGDIDLEIVFVELGALLDERDMLGGVARKPFLVEVVAIDVLEPFSLGAVSLLSKTLRTPSISVSVLAMRSFRVRQRLADSAWRLRVSPFLVTRSWTPLSIIERTLEVAGM